MPAAITIAVLGTGPDLVYPARHRELAARIVAARARWSASSRRERPAQPENFPRRNRIIAGLALGTLVVEAGLRSGSLITARCAERAGPRCVRDPGLDPQPARARLPPADPPGREAGRDRRRDHRRELAPLAAAPRRASARAARTSGAESPGARRDAAQRDPEYARLHRPRSATKRSASTSWPSAPALASRRCPRCC